MKNKIIVKDNSAILQLQNIQIEYSDPKIETFNSYRIKDEKDIMYFYYDVIISKRNFGEKIKPIVRGSVYEDGIAPYIEKYITSILDTDMSKDSVKRYFNSHHITTDETEYILMKYFKLNGMFNEDVINIERIYKTFKDCRGRNEFEYYNVYFGTGGNDFDNTSEGVTVSELVRKDIELIREFGKKFMNLAIKKRQIFVNKCLSGEVDYDEDPKIFKEHLKNKYGITDWKDKFIKLADKEYIFDEYMSYIKGEKNIDELSCREWHGKERTAKQLLKRMKDYEVYLYLCEDNEYKKEDLKWVFYFPCVLA